MPAGPEVGDPRRRLERAARRHDLAPDRRDAVGGQGALVRGLERVDHRRFALRAKRRRALGTLERADRRRDFGAPVEQAEQLAVDGVDALAQRLEVGGGGGDDAGIRPPSTCWPAGPAVAAAGAGRRAPAGGTPRMVRIRPSSAISFGSRMGGISAISFWLKLLRSSTGERLVLLGGGRFEPGDRAASARPRSSSLRDRRRSSTARA